VEIDPTSPGIFVLNGAGQGAVVNPDGSLNSPLAPASRGQVVVIYGTGLGAVSSQGKLSVVTQPVTAVVNGQELPVAFAGLAPGFVGLYQVNVPLPSALAPGLNLPFALRQAGVSSNSVGISIY
jgi:uncharacterized protein (TIGR03437 family)